MLISSAALVAGLTSRFAPHLPAAFNTENWITCCATAYVMFWILRSRDPKAGFLGSVLTAIVTLQLVTASRLGPELAFQLAAVFLLLHSLRWADDRHPGATALRFFTGTVWLAHAVLLVHSDVLYAGPVVYAGGGLVLGVCLLMRTFRGHWQPIAAPIAAVLVLLTQPGNFVGNELHSTPVGIRVVTGSFLLFGLGTVAALTKSKWNLPSANNLAKAETNKTR
jgi:hypothetical protein